MQVRWSVGEWSLMIAEYRKHRFSLGSRLVEILLHPDSLRVCWNALPSRALLRILLVWHLQMSFFSMCGTCGLHGQSVKKIWKCDWHITHDVSHRMYVLWRKARVSSYAAGVAFSVHVIEYIRNWFAVVSVRVALVECNWKYLLESFL